MILCSVFRDAAGYVDRFNDQVKALREILPVTVVCAEGDSTDDTYTRLRDTDYLVLKVEHGGPKFDSVDHPLRWRQLAAVCNVALTAAVRELGADEPLVYMESDLRWDADTIDELAARTNKFPAVAPLSMRGGRFYDLWGYRKDDRRFGPHPPFHPGLDRDRMTMIDTAGSCTAFSPTAARVVHFDHDDCILGLGRSLYANGLSLWLAPDLEVRHP